MLKKFVGQKLQNFFKDLSLLTDKFLIDNKVVSKYFLENDDCFQKSEAFYKIELVLLVYMYMMFITLTSELSYVKEEILQICLLRRSCPA